MRSRLKVAMFSMCQKSCRTTWAARAGGELRCGCSVVFDHKLGELGFIFGEHTERTLAAKKYLIR